MFGILNLVSHSDSSNRYQLLGVTINIVVILVNWIVVSVITVAKHLVPFIFIDKRGTNFETYYTPYCRSASYCVGILLAYVLRNATANRAIIEMHQMNPFATRKIPLKGLMMLIQP